MYSELSVLIKEVSVYNNPSKTYFNSFLSRFKMYRKTKIIKQRVLAFSGIIALAIVAYISYTSITRDKVDLQTAAGIENVKP